MKRIFLNPVNAMAIVLSLGLAATVTSCSTKGCTDPAATNYDPEADKEDDSCEYPVNEEVTKTGELSADETWTANNIYILDGRVVVPSGVTLTIEAGTIIKGAEGQETEASALIVARGGKIMAEGTADAPIIFTTVLDGITYGETESKLSRTDNEKWGGVAILGSAPISAEDGDTETNLEGIPAEAGYGKFGGSDASDNSGVLKYVSIRHGGISIGEGNELNGLTLGGVGNGTTIENIEIYATLDDGIEFFGGTVNASNLLVYYQGDDGLDVDMNYAGTISNFAVIHGDGIGTDEGLEIDGPEGTANDGLFTIENGICMSEGSSDGSAADFKSKAQGTVRNVTFDYSSLGGKDVKIRASYNGDCTDKEDAFTHLTGSPATLVFDACNMSGVKVYENNDPEACTTQNDANDAAGEAAITMDGAGASINVATTFSWTNASAKGQL
mgnify:CR=1 FL=1